MSSASSPALEYDADIGAVVVERLARDGFCAEPSIAAAVDAIVGEHGRIDVLFHNAGHMVYDPSEAFTPEQLGELYDGMVFFVPRMQLKKKRAGMRNPLIEIAMGRREHLTLRSIRAPKCAAIKRRTFRRRSDWLRTQSPYGAPATPARSASVQLRGASTGSHRAGALPGSATV